MFHRLYHLLLTILWPRPRNVLCWIAALALGYGILVSAWLNDGHFTCDFAGQWLMGKMVTTGRAAETYWGPAEREVLALGFDGDELEQMDKDILKKCPQGQVHTGVEGPLYPPTMGILMIPFSLMQPRAAHAVLVLLYVQLAFLSGWLIKDITRSRLRMGEAALFVLLFPHFGLGLVLGQNAALTLAILAGGWALWARGWAFSCGLLWGLLAYKPVFAVAVLLVPILLWSRRLLLGLLAGGGLFCFATLFVCGFDLLQFADGTLALNPEHPWRRWLTVGSNASIIYSYDVNWIWMSRDLIGLPRRDMWNLDYLWDHWIAAIGRVTWDMKQMQPADLSETATHIGVGLVIGIGGMTALAVLASALWRRLVLNPPCESNPSQAERVDHILGSRPAFILMGALFTCYHFMWYDLQPFALPVALLLADAGRLRWPGRVWLLLLGTGLFGCLLNLSLGVGTIALPFEVFLLLAAWLWAGWRMLADGSTATLEFSLALDHVQHHPKRIAEVEPE